MDPSPSAAVLSPNSYYASLDFFSLVGLDAHSGGHTPQLEHDSPAPGSSGSGQYKHHSSNGSGSGSASASAVTYSAHQNDFASGSPDEPLDDPSPISLDARTPSGPGRRRSAGSVTQPQSQPRSARSSIHAGHKHAAASMDFDHGAGGSSGAGAGAGSGHAANSGNNTPAIDASDLLNMDVSGAAYDAIQAGILQHQLESIHMQSPFINAGNPSSPYGAMAQMFLTSPPGQHPPPGNLPDSSTSQSDRPGFSRKYSLANVVSGVLTPGPSGDIHPEVRMDLMSPMQLEMLSRGESIEGMENFHSMPLLSPALSHTASTFTSPVAHVAFNSAKENQYALEQLQVQQRQFQEQLALLQEQQKQLQATAAAVAAASGSPFLNPQPQPRPGVASGGMSSTQSSGGPISSTPSPGSYFSPLTSPALEPAVSRSAALRAAAAHFSPALHSQQHQRPPHPLSALSSPALNPVGSSGGAQQTLSPALLPQLDGADPDYLNALQGILDGGSPAIGPSGQTQMSPVVGGNATGPHRGSLSAKSRPSPMMKPTNHRSHRPQAPNSVPTSPMAFKAVHSGMGFLPPAAIDQRGVQQQQLQQQGSSTASTPSPVDLTQMMPPPPIPTPTSRPKSLLPITPASLMNLGKPESEAESSRADTAAPPTRAAAKKAATAIAPATQHAHKRGSRLVPSGGSAAAKRALAIRPAGGVGVRAATKGAAAAAAAAANSTEPEARRTSHKAAEQKRRDSLKAGFDELRLLLPPINTEALDPESGEPIPGSSAPRLLPKSSLVPDDNPNRGVSKVALLKFSNEYIVRLHNKVEKRDAYIDKLRDEIRRLRVGDGIEVRGDEGEDLLDMDMLEGEEDDLGDSEDEDGDDMDVDDVLVAAAAAAGRKKSTGGSSQTGKSPALGPTRRAAPKPLTKRKTGE